MEKTPFFGSNIAPNCAYCRHSTRAQDALLCGRTGEAVPPVQRCADFVYDQLRRAPRRLPDLPAFTPEDFKL